MRPPTLQSSVHEWLLFRPGLSRVFSQHGIDLCQDVDRTLADACAARQIDNQQMLTQLTSAATPQCCELGANWRTAPLPELLQHILDVHHAFYARELPRLTGLIEKVVAKYEGTHPEVKDVEQAFNNFCCHFIRHLDREEKELFPAIRRLISGEPQPAPFSRILSAVNALESDHERADAELQQIRKLTAGFSAPNDVCETYRAMVDGLWELEMNVHQNVYEENEFLFPRAIRREAASSS